MEEEVTSSIVALSELEIGLTALAFTLAIFGIQGLLSVLPEGRRLHLDRVRTRQTNPLSAAIIVVSLALFVISVFLGTGIVRAWSPRSLGTFEGLG